MHHELAFQIPTCCKQSRHLCQTLGVKPGRGSFDFSQGACEGNCQRELGFSQGFSAGNRVLNPNPAQLHTESILILSYIHTWNKHKALLGKCHIEDLNDGKQHST
jgi:hypothetical protein